MNPVSSSGSPAPSVSQVSTLPALAPQARPNVDPGELAKFAALAHHWWDPSCDLFGPLHALNPLRLDWVRKVTGGIEGKRVVDVGCGGGILTEALARDGGDVLGIDLGEESLGVARLHRLESGVDADYRLIAVEALAAESPASFDVVTCMEMLEHVPAPEPVVTACARLLKPGGIAVFSTINRNPKAYAMAILGAEYLLRLLPRGTHDYARFLRPSELARFARHGGLVPLDATGLVYNPLTKAFRLDRDTSVNYLMAFTRPADA